MTPEEFVAIVESIDLRGIFQTMGLELRPEVRETDFGRGVNLTVRWQAPDRETGEVRTFQTSEGFSSEELKHYFRDDSFALRVIKRNVVAVVMHEADEGLWRDGKQLHDPHNIEIPIRGPRMQG